MSSFKYVSGSVLIFSLVLNLISCVSTDVYEKTTEQFFQDGVLIGERTSLVQDGKVVSKGTKEFRTADTGGMHVEALVSTSDKEQYDTTNIKLYKKGALIGERDIKSKDGKIVSGAKTTATENKEEQYKSLVDYGTFVFVEGEGKVQSFYASKTEVTQAEFSAVMGTNPSKNKGDKLPVEAVSFFDALEYCNKKSLAENKTPVYSVRGTTWSYNRNADGYRLLTLDEFKYASGGGKQKSDFTYSGSSNAGEVAWYKNNSGKNTHNVASKKSNALGLYDMSGNVSEWVWGDNRYYVCGGSFLNEVSAIKPASYLTVRQDVYKDVGFRIARNATAQEKQAFKEKQQLAGNMDSYFVSAFNAINAKNNKNVSTEEKFRSMQSLSSTEKISVASSLNTPYMLYSFVGKPFVVLGSSGLSLVKCLGYACVNFIGGYSAATGGDVFWMMPDTKKAKEKAAYARENNGISYYPEYHKAFTNNHIEVTSYNQDTSNKFSQLTDNEAKVSNEEHLSYDNSLSVERSISADANATASVVGWVGTAITVPVSAITWVGGAAFGLYSSIMGSN